MINWNQNLHPKKVKMVGTLNILVVRFTENTEKIMRTPGQDLSGRKRQVAKPNNVQ